MCKDTYIHTYTHTHTHTYIHTHIHTDTHTYIHIHMYIHTHTHIHTDIHTYTYIHTYIHTHFLRKGTLTQSIDLEVEPKNWPHPAEVAAFIVRKEYGNETIQIYTDGSRNELGVGAGVAMFAGNELFTTLKYRLDNRCSNNQAEQLAIAKALEALEKTYIE